MVRGGNKIEAGMTVTWGKRQMSVINTVPRLVACKEKLDGILVRGELVLKSGDLLATGAALMWRCDCGGS